MVEGLVLVVVVGKARVFHRAEAEGLRVEHMVGDDIHLRHIVHLMLTGDVFSP